MLAPANRSITTQTVIQSTTYTASLSGSIGVTVTDQYGNLLVPRLANPTETVVASNPSIYTMNIPGFDPSRSGYFVWDNGGAVFARTPFNGPGVTKQQPAPFYKPQFPAVQR